MNTGKDLLDAQFEINEGHDSMHNNSAEERFTEEERFLAYRDRRISSYNILQANLERLEEAHAEAVTYTVGTVEEDDHIYGELVHQHQRF